MSSLSLFLFFNSLSKEETYSITVRLFFYRMNYNWTTYGMDPHNVRFRTLSCKFTSCIGDVHLIMAIFCIPVIRTRLRNDTRRLFPLIHISSRTTERCNLYKGSGIANSSCSQDFRFASARRRKWPDAREREGRMGEAWPGQGRS